jgi:predicted RecA/RadA family phage recombinase
MKNFIQEGHTLDIVSGGALNAGALYLSGGIVGVVQAGVTGSGQNTTVATRGVFTMAKATGQVWAAGTPLYWDAGNSRFTSVFAEGLLGGFFAAGAAASAATTGPVAIGFGAGLKVACGQHTTVAASDTVATGLAKVLAVVASLESDPTDNPEWVTAQIGNQAGAPAAGSIIIKTWQNTGGTDPTPAAASTFSKLVNWVAVGY